MRILSCLALALLVPPSLAGETAWQRVAPEVAMRLISSGEVRADGRTLVGLEIAMPETTKTYWRVPGEIGIPTELDLSASTGIAAHEVLWPYPTVDEANGYLDYAYYGHTVLPVELQLDGAPAELVVSALLGVCSEICIPVQARFSLPLGAEPADPGNALRLRQAAALAPVDWSAPRQPLGTVRYDASAHALAVELSGAEIDPATLLGAVEGGEPVLGAAEPVPEGGRVLLPLLGRADAEALRDRPVELVFLTGEGAFSLSRRILAD